MYLNLIYKLHIGEGKPTTKPKKVKAKPVKNDIVQHENNKDSQQSKKRKLNDNKIKNVVDKGENLQNSRSQIKENDINNNIQHEDKIQNLFNDNQLNKTNEVDELKEKLIETRIAINLLENDIKSFERILNRKEYLSVSSIERDESYLSKANSLRKWAVERGLISVYQDDDMSLFPESEDWEETFY